MKCADKKLLIVCRLIVYTESNVPYVKNSPSKNPLIKLLAKRVRALRLELGLSQEELAEETGLHRTYVGSIERAERNVSLVNIGIIAKALGVSASELISESKPEVSR